MKKTLILLSLAAGMTAGFAVPNISEAQATNDLGIKLLPGESFDQNNAFIDNFDNGLDSNVWDIATRTWSDSPKTPHGGISPKNITYDNDLGVIRLHAKGNQYAKNEFVSNGSVKDGSNTGACIILKQDVTPGRFEVRMKIAPRVGVCNAMWTYTEDATNDNKNHEIDIELPGKSGANNDFNQVMFTNYIGTAPQGSVKHTPVKLPFALNDNEYHTYGFDWYYSNKHKQINYYIDGVEYARHTDLSSTPYLNNKLWLGTWIPNNVNFVGLPDFDETFMEVDYFKFIPFKNQITQTNKPGDCMVASPDQFPTQPTKIDRLNYFANGDFEFAAIPNNKHTNIGINYSKAQVKYGKQYGLNSSGALITNGSLNQNIDSMYGGQEYEFDLDYKGEGTFKINFYDENKKYISNISYPLSSTKWTHFNTQKFTCPANTFATQVYISGPQTLNLDNIFVGKSLVKEVPPTPDPEPEVPSVNITSSFNTTMSKNANIKTNGNQVLRMQDVAFNGNKNQTWKLSFYIKNNADDTLLFGYRGAVGDVNNTLHTADPNLLKHTSFTQIANIMQDEQNKLSGALTEKHFVQAMYMNYDLDNFNDITFFFKAMKAGDPHGGIKWYKHGIVYSIDSGTTWKCLKYYNFLDTQKGSASSLIDPYYISATKADLKGVTFDKIRFGYGTLAFIENGVGVNMSGIVINNLDSFKDNIDSKDMCNFNNVNQEMMNVMYSKLTANDKNHLASTLRKGSKTQTYQQGYDYLMKYWSGAKVNNVANALTADEDSLVIFATVILISLVSLFAFIYIARKRLN